MLTDGAIRVLVGRLSTASHTDTMEPVRLIFNDASGFVTCFVSSLFQSLGRYFV